MNRPFAKKSTNTQDEQKLVHDYAKLIATVLIGVLGWILSQSLVKINEFRNEQGKRQVDFYFELLSAAADYTQSAFPPVSTPDDLLRVERKKDAVREAMQRHEKLYWSKHAYLLSEAFEGCFSNLRDRINATHSIMEFDIADGLKPASAQAVREATDKFIFDRNSLHRLMGVAGAAVRDYHVGHQGFSFVPFTPSVARDRRCQ
jgi:hypothetical protein